MIRPTPQSFNPPSKPRAKAVHAVRLARKLREVPDQAGAPNPNDVQETSGFTKITDGVNTP